MLLLFDWDIEHSVMIVKSVVYVIIIISVCCGLNDERNSSHSWPSMESNQLSTQIRGIPPTRPPSTCTVTKAELDDLLKEIAKISNGTNQNHLNLNEVDNTDPPIHFQCAQLAEIKTSIKKIASFVSDIIRNSENEDELKKLVSYYEEELTKINIKLQEVERDVDQKYQKEIKDLREQLNAKLLENTRLSQTIKKLKLQLREKNIRLCVHIIGNENLSECHVILRDELLDVEAVELIVERAHNTLPGGKLIFIVQFVEELNQIDKKIAAAVKLFNVMSQKSTLENPSILPLKTILRGHFISNKLDQAADRVTAAWAHLISIAHTQPIMNYVRISNFSRHSISPFICDIIEKAYNKPRFQNILNFSKNLQLGEQIYIAHKCLWTKMETSRQTIGPETLMLAYQVKMSLNTQNYRDLYVYNRLPSFAKKIVFEGSAHLYNTDYTQFLASPSYHYYYNYDRLNVFLSRSNSLDWSANTKWFFETEDEGRTFFIKSWRNWQYLYAADGNHVNGNYRYVFTWRNGQKIYNGKFNWYIEPTSSANIMLKNVAYNEYFFASGYTYNHEYRNVYTWRPGVQIRNGIWTVR